MYRRLLTLVAAVSLFASAAFGGQWNTTIAAAQAQAKAKNQLILVDMYASWCGWCKKMAQEVFPTETFQNRAKNLVLLKVDTEDGGEGSKLARDMEVTTLPTFLLLTKDMKLAGVIYGYNPAPAFVKEIDESVASWNRFQKDVKDEKSHAGDYAWRFALAKEFMKRHDFDAGAKRLEVLSSDPKLPGDLWANVMYYLALAQAGKGDYAKSMVALDKLIKTQREGRVAEQSSLFKAELLYQERHYKNALAELMRFQKAYPESVLMPNVLRMLPRFERAAGSAH